MKLGTTILVRNDENEKWQERILVSMTPDAFICVTKGTEKEFLNNEDFAVNRWKEAKKMPDKFYVWEKLSEDGQHIVPTVHVTDELAEREGYAELGFTKNLASERTWSEN